MRTHARGFANLILVILLGACVAPTARAAVLAPVDMRPDVGVEIDQDRLNQLLLDRFDDRVRPGVRLAEAIASARTGIRDNPGDPALRVELGALLIHSRRFYDAAEAFVEALRIDPEHEEAMNGFGIALLLNVDPYNAARVYERLVQMKPAHPDYRFNLASAYFRINRFDDSARHLKALLERHPNHAEGWYNLGMTHLARAEPEHGLQALETSHEKNPSNPDPLLAMARYHSRKGERADMINALRRLRDVVGMDVMELVVRHPTFEPWNPEVLITELRSPATE